jgi:protein XagA
LFQRIKITYSCCLSLILFLVMAASCLAGGWTQPEGKLYSRFALNYYTADENYNADGDRRDFSDNGDFSDLNASLYLEYGLSQNLTLISNMTYKYLHYEDNAVDSKTYGMGDMELAARYCLWRNATSSFSAQGLVKIPEAYEENKRVPLGNGQYDAEIRLLFGQSLHPFIPGYFNIEAGYRFRCEEPADEFRYLVELGMDFTKKFYGRVKLDGILGIGNENRTMDIAGNPTTTADFDLGKLDICIGCNLTGKFGVEIGYAPSIYGKNTAVGATWTAAIVYKTQ